MPEVIYEPLSDQALVDPYPIYEMLRRERPVFWHEQMRSWVLTRHEDCKRVLLDHKTFARDRRRAGIEIPEFRQSLQSLDPPHLESVRRIFVRAFRSAEPASVHPELIAYIDRLISNFATGEVCEWMQSIAAPTALALSARLMGVNEPDPADYSSISEGIAYRMDAGVAPERGPIGDSARTRLNDLAKSWIKDAQESSNGSGVLNYALANAEDTDIPQHLVDNSIAMMFNASYGTIFATLGNIGLLLASDPDLLPAFSGRDDGDCAKAVDELLRIDGPAQGTTRVAVADTVIGDQKVNRGELVLPLLAAANRDPAVFDDPNSIRFDRTPNPHLSFGAGSHACLGALFGRTSVQLVIKSLINNNASLTVAGRVVRRRTATVRSVERLPLTLT